MNRRYIDVAECSEELIRHLQKGVFLTSRSKDKVNSMVIGWGHIGRVWSLPVFIAFVRQNRYTRQLIDETMEFTVNVPVNGADRKAFEICGTMSGKDMDKIAESGLTLVDSEKVSVPAIKEFPLTLECKVIYRQEQKPEDLPEELQKKYYDGEPEHVCYYGQILSAYILEDQQD